MLPALAVVAAATTAVTQQPLIHYAIPTALVVSALAERSPSVAPSLTPDRIQLPAGISSTVADPILHLLSTDLRPDGSLSLRLACRTSAECLPFFATLSTSDRTDALALLGSLRGSPALPAASPNPSPARVSLGTRVRLQLANSQMRIQIEGIAIDTAEAGHEVRIASLDRRQTYRGVVIDATTVRGDLP